MKIVLISDYHLSQVPGGAERNDACLESLLSRRHTVSFLRTEEFNGRFKDLNDSDLFVFSNFSLLSPSAEQFALRQNYVIIEHDFKFTPTRNPLIYENFVVPPDKRAHEEFYARAKVVVLQSRFQLSIFQRNLALENCYCFSGNLWPDEELDLMERFSGGAKSSKVAVLSSDAPAKGTQAAIDYCRARQLPYDLIREANHTEFLKLLGKHSSFVFLPWGPESFSRVCLEAKMMGLTVITHDAVGAATERLFSMPPREVIQVMREKEDELLELIEKHL